MNIGHLLSLSVLRTFMWTGRPRAEKSLTLPGRDSRRAIGSEDSNFNAAFTQLIQCGDHIVVIRRTTQIEIETIFPRPAFDGTALNLQQVDAASRERIERVVQRARLVREFDDQRKFVRLNFRISFWRE